MDILIKTKGREKEMLLRHFWAESDIDTSQTGKIEWKIAKAKHVTQLIIIFHLDKEQHNGFMACKPCIYPDKAVKYKF